MSDLIESRMDKRARIYIKKTVEMLFMDFAHCVHCEVYLCISITSRNAMFSGTVPDYVFIYVFLLFPEMLCFQALCKTGSSQWSVFETDITMS